MNEPEPYTPYAGRGVNSTKSRIRLTKDGMEVLLLGGRNKKIIEEQTERVAKALRLLDAYEDYQTKPKRRTERAKFIKEDVE